MVELMAEMIASSLFYWPVNKFAKNGVTDANKSRRPLHTCLLVSSGEVTGQESLVSRYFSSFQEVNTNKLIKQIHKLAFII